MEQNSTLATTDTVVPEQKPCISCGNPDVLKGYPNTLCAACREQYIKFPIPLWVKAFGGGIALLVIILLFNLPKTLMPEIYYEKGITAAEKHKYATAERNLRKAVDATPDFYEAQAELLVAAFYNEDMITVGKMVDKLSGRNFDDEELLAKVNRVMDYAATYLPGDSLNALAESHPAASGGLTVPVIQQFVVKYPDNIYAKIVLARRLMNDNNYVAADSLVQVVLQKDPKHLIGLETGAVVKRMLGDEKSALAYCDRALAINKECVFAIANKSRISLKMKDYKQGLVYAKDAVNINDTDFYAAASLVLAYHFNNMQPERDELIAKVKKRAKGDDETSLQFALDVINKKDSL